MYKIELASKADLATLSQISVASKMHWGYPKEWWAHWQEDLTVTEKSLQENTIHKLVFADSIIGFCAIAAMENYYEINHLWLLPSYIGQGLGKVLLEESLKRSIKQSALVKVIADPNAAAFYAKRGFQAIDQIESYPKGRFLPVMEKFHAVS